MPEQPVPTQIEAIVFRQCDEFDVLKNWKTFCVFSRKFGAEFAGKFVRDPDGVINAGESVKQGRSTTVTKVYFGDTAFIVKRYNKKSNRHRIARSLLESRAAVVWKFGHLLMRYDIPTVAPVLMLEQRRGPFKLGSYVITEYIDGVSANIYFENDQTSASAKRSATKINQLVEKLHRVGYAHGDLKAPNVLIANQMPVLIDLDSMKKINHKRESMIEKDWARLKKDLGQSAIAPILFP